jgi:hypothetical protein
VCDRRISSCTATATAWASATRWATTTAPSDSDRIEIVGVDCDAYLGVATGEGHHQGPVPAAAATVLMEK